ncbi:MAG: hypothetical protein AAGI88_15660 [Pseudomonadota bacterium]
MASAAANVRCNVELKNVAHRGRSVQVSDGTGNHVQFDHVVIATQADQALRLLPESMPAEREALARFRYQNSRLVVHEDLRLAPVQRSDWAPVNFVLSRDHEMPMASIWMNSIYPDLKHRRPVFETWNPFDDVAIENPIIDVTVDRPVVTRDSIDAVHALHQMQQAQDRKIWFCGSYAERGIPLLESAVASAKVVADRLAQQRR